MNMYTNYPPSTDIVPDTKSHYCYIVNLVYCALVIYKKVTYEKQESTTGHFRWLGQGT